MNKAVSAISAIAFALIGVTLFGLWYVYGEVSQIPTQVADEVQRTLDQRLDAVSKNVDSIETKVDEQTSVIHRSLGKVIPFKLPDDARTRLASVQEQINGAIQSPVDPTTMERMRTELADIVGALPPWAQEEMLPTLVPLRWDLEALWALTNASGVGDGSLEESVSSLDALLENRPIGSSDSLSSKLGDQRKAFQARISAADKALALATATQIGNLSDTDEVAAAIQGLAPYMDDAQAKELSGQLKTTLARRLVVRAADDLNKSIDQYKKLSSVEMRQYAFSRAGQTAIELQLQLISAGVRDEKVTSTLQQLYHTARELELKEIAAEKKSASQRDAARRQQYQAWALTQMANVSSLAALKNTGLTEPKALLQLRLDMTKYFAPIDEGLLDVAVGQWFRNRYSIRFDELGDDGKRKLIGAFASTPKMTLEALP